jgi:hypothetical protein
VPGALYGIVWTFELFSTQQIVTVTFPAIFYIDFVESRLNKALRFHAYHLAQIGSPHILGRDVSIPAR